MSATIDEQTAMVADLLEEHVIDGTPAVAILHCATGLCPRLAAQLLKRELRRRVEEGADRVLRDVRRDPGDGSDPR